jgi:hypothetical protein
LLDKFPEIAVYYCETYYIGNEGKNLRKGFDNREPGQLKAGINPA